MGSQSLWRYSRDGSAGTEHRVDLFLQELSSDRPGGNGFIRIDRLDISDIPSVNAAKETQFRARY